MKFIALCFVFTAFTGSVTMAQNMGIKDIPADGDTTIRIQKGANKDAEYEVTTGKDDITGDAAPLLKDARANWKTACADWKKETKELNKDSQVLSLSCGKMTCSTVAMESTCTSEATHKIRVKIK